MISFCCCFAFEEENHGMLMGENCLELITVLWTGCMFVSGEVIILSVLFPWSLPFPRFQSLPDGLNKYAFSFVKTVSGAIIYQFKIICLSWLLMPTWGFKLLAFLCTFLIKMLLESLVAVYVLVMASDCAVATARKLGLLLSFWVSSRKIMS